MVKLKTLKLKSYCGYRDSFFDFSIKNTRGDLSIYSEIPNDGNVKNLVCLYGENGSGKSSLLDAINILGSSYQYEGREDDLLFRKLTYHPDYDPTLAGFIKSNENMEIEGVFSTKEGDKKVIINSNGVVLNELPMKDYPREYVYYIDADNPVNLARFQTSKQNAKLFLEIAKTIYGMKCFLDGEVEENGQLYYSDFIIEKKCGTKVHYRRMSDGERKIAQLIDALCNPIWTDNIDIILIDSIDKEVYFERHARMIDKIIDVFPNKQFIIATHSPILVGLDDKELNIHIPAYLYYECLYNVEEYQITEEDKTKNRINYTI
jgi:predicted ATPase